MSASYTLDNIFAFNFYDGLSPVNVTLDPSGNIFGTTAKGGTSGVGTVFEIIHGTTAVTTLATFNIANGATPDGGLTLDSNGNLFGTTSQGGAGGYGTVFEVLHGTTAITTLASFNKTNGAFPDGGVTLDSSGNLFGTTSQGGTSNFGAVFEIVHSTAAITTLASFNGANGANPQSRVVLDSGGNLFGTTTSGSSGYGTVFEIVKGTTAISTLAMFSSTTGYYPLAGLTLDSSGDLFGTTNFGGASNFGTVFKIAHGSSTITTLGTFNKTNGAYPYASLTLDPSGNLFGTTSQGGTSNYGTVFEIVHGTTVLTTVANFNSTNGANPNSTLSRDSSGNLFGTTSSGGTSNFGTVFEIVHGTTAITTVASFKNTFGYNPYAGMIRDSTGNLFGTTYSGGTYDSGTVFEVARGTTAIISLASFNNSNGANPYGGLTFDSKGNLFGTTCNGGTNDYGTVFEIVKGTRVITTIARFNSTNGANPRGTLTVDSSGNLFGTTERGGDSDLGTVFKIVHGTTTIITLASFDYTLGAYPFAGLTLDPSGNLFGTTTQGGISDDGTAYEIVHGTTAITTLGSFNETNGAYPYASLTRDSSGNLFGTTMEGGTSHDGTVFEIVHGTTSVTTLANLDESTGDLPFAGLIFDSSGNLFGTAAFGGPGNYGTVFEIARGTTAVIPLASFDGTNGSHPYGTVTLDSSGNLLGTTNGGITTGYGSVFELSPSPPTVSFIKPPTSTNGGTPINGATGVQVGIFYHWGNISTVDSSTVTLTLAGGRFADGSTTVTAATVNGVATFANLVINAAGNYTLIATDSALASTTSASFTVLGIAVIGTSGNDSISLRKDADGVHLDEWLNSPTPGVGTPTTRYLLTGAASLSVDGAGGNDRITLDLSNGDLLLAKNSVADTGGLASVKIIGTGSSDTLALDGSSGKITWNTGTSAKVITVTGVASVEYQDLGGLDNVSVTGGITLTLDMGPDSNTLSVAAGANATVNFGASSGELTVNGNGDTSLVFGSGNPTFHFVTTPVDPVPATGAISGVVFEDTNGDGKRESADKGLAGRKLYIDSNHNGKLDLAEPTAVTDASGAYYFAGLASGMYRVREVIPAGYRASTPAAGYLEVTVAAGKKVSGEYFGQTREILISGVVFRDANHDGKRQANEAALSGWVVYLDTNSNGKLDNGEVSFTTGATGKYSFVAPAGKYHLREVTKKGFTPSASSIAGYALILTNGQWVTGKNLGNW